MLARQKPAVLPISASFSIRVLPVKLESYCRCCPRHITQDVTVVGGGSRRAARPVRFNGPRRDPGEEFTPEQGRYPRGNPKGKFRKELTV